MDAATLEMIQRGGFLLLLFVAVVTVCIVLFGQIEQRRKARDRLQGSNAPSAISVDPGANEIASLRTFDTRSSWIDVVQRVEEAGLPLVDPNDPTLRNRLAAAGYEHPHAPAIYSVIRLGLVVLLPVGMFLFMWLSGSSPSVMRLYVTGAFFAFAGLVVPSLWLRIKAARRQEEIVNGFPDALDLMLVCVEAGLGLEAAFNRVGMEITRSHPLLAKQFGMVVLELRAGRSHEDALRRMAERAGSEEIRGFATLLVQSTRLGSSIAQTLRTYASEMRERRRMRAEEKAHRLPVLLSVPLVAFMLPTMIGVMMLPAFIRVVRTLIPAMAGDVGQ